jgi:phage repressor protein C with HTH and peptisase S24 domain
MNRTERFRVAYEYLRYKKVVNTQKDVAEKMKAARANISSALAGKENILTDSFVARFCATFKEISYTWLLLGEGDMLSNREKSVNDRIRDVLKIESKSLKSIGEKVGEDFSVLQRCIEDDVEPSEEAVSKFCVALNINEEWIKTGDGEIYDSDQALINKAALKKHMEALPTRPRLPKNTSDGHIEHYYGKGKKRMLCQEKPIITQFVDYDFSLILKNNRMSPKYDRGDELFFKKSEIIEWGNDYLIDTAEGAKFKKIKDEGDKVRCVSYNAEDYPDFFVPKDKIYGYYRLVGVLRIL